MNIHLYADEIVVNDNLAVEGGRNFVASVRKLFAGFQISIRKGLQAEGLLRNSVTYHTACIGTMKMTRGFGGTCFNDQATTAFTVAVLLTR
jgi:hypothetical protein